VPNDSEFPRLTREAEAQLSLAPSKPTKKSRKRKRNERSNDHELCNDDQEDNLEHEVNIVTLVLQLPGGHGYATRHITREVLRCLSITADDIIPCTTEVFDRWYSCMCFGLRHTLPKRVYRLKELPWGCIHVDEGIPETTIHTLLDTYCLSQSMGTTVVSDMLLDEINRSLKNEKIFYRLFGGLGSICEENCNYVVACWILSRQMSRGSGNKPRSRILSELFWSTFSPTFWKRPSAPRTCCHKAFLRPVLPRCTAPLLGTIARKELRASLMQIIPSYSAPNTTIMATRKPAPC
jgi:hypothetical protein